MDFTSSGLENPLSYFLLALFAVQFFAGEERPADGRRLTLLLLTVGAALTCRNDLLLLILPALGLALWRARPLGLARLARALAIGFAPLACWMLFSLFYYGFPFPNTAYAKLSTGIPTLNLCEQGLFYFANSIRWDPVLFLALLFSVGLVARAKDRLALALVAGLGLHLIYVVKIGGDFMHGRFLSTAFFLGVICLVRHLPDARTAARLALAILIYSAAWPLAPLRGGVHYINTKVDYAGIADERGYYFPYTSLWAYLRTPAGAFFPRREATSNEPKPAGADRRVETAMAVGFAGYWAGPDKIIIDRMALCDPLLARLPALSFWRPGHFARALPEGYLESVRSGTNQLVDSRLRAYYQKLKLVTQGDLLAAGRLKAILELNWNGSCF